MKALPDGLLKRLAALRGDESGVIMLETVLIFPLQLLLTMLVVQVALVFVGANVVHYAAFQSARTATLAMRGKTIDSDANSAARRAAATICSSLHNPTTASGRAGKLKLRAFRFNYYFPREAMERVDCRLSYIEPGGKPWDSFVECDLRYWMPLVVPLGAQALRTVLPSGDSPGSVNKIAGSYSLCLQQRAAIPKVWPH